jgi:hypothetical protein
LGVGRGANNPLIIKSKPVMKHKHEPIKMALLVIGWGGVDWIGLAEDRDKWRAPVNAVMNLRVA